MAAGDDYTFDSATISLSDADLTELGALYIGIWSNETGSAPIAAELTSLPFISSASNLHTLTADTDRIDA